MFLLDVAGHADDLEPGRFAVRIIVETDPPPDRLAIGKIALNATLADDGHAGRPFRIVNGKAAASQDRNFHDVEIIGADRLRIRPAFRRFGTTLDRKKGL